MADWKARERAARESLRTEPEHLIEDARIASGKWTSADVGRLLWLLLGNLPWRLLVYGYIFAAGYVLGRWLS